MLGLSAVKNEQDIIEPFVRHHLQALDYLIVLDNGSVDKTKRILARLAQEFSNLFVINDDVFGNRQVERMRRLLRISQSAYRPDYVFFLDADEFLSTADRQEIARVLSKIPRGGFGLVPWATYVLTPESLQTASLDPPKSIIWRRTQETPMFRKAVLHLDHDDGYEDLLIEYGSHFLKRTSGRTIPHVDIDDLKLLHFPVRSREQFIAHVIVGWMANLGRDSAARASNLGWHKRIIFDRIVAGEPIDVAFLCECSALYAQDRNTIDWRSDVVEDAPKIDYIRRYSTGAPADALQLIAASWEQSMQSTARVALADLQPSPTWVRTTMAAAND
jgi:glycosyltransferase involved in cell wall biosynthesis